MRPSLSYQHEREMARRGFLCVAGVDEVGAGALAGDVFAAAVVLRPGTRLKGVHDSKRMTSAAREYWDAVIRRSARYVAIGRASVAEIDALNIRQAAFLAMRRAIAQIDEADAVLCDGFMIPHSRVACVRVVHGDALVKSIAAASVVAKVARDAYMRGLAEHYPAYGFDRHKGYATQEHRRAVLEHGMSDVHRAVFCRNMGVWR